MMRIFIALCAVLSGAAHAVATVNKDPWIAVLDPSSQKTYFVHRHTREKRWASEDRAAPEPPDTDRRVGWSQRPFGEYVGLSDKELEQHIEAWLKREDQRERDGLGPLLVDPVDFDFGDKAEAAGSAASVGVATDGGFVSGSYSEEDPDAPVAEEDAADATGENGEFEDDDFL